MAHLAKRIVAAASVLAMVTTAWGFTLRGPSTTWMTTRLGYNIGAGYATTATIRFGPMIPGEEYRLNVPVMYYGFTPAFMTFFGERGAEEIDKAFKVLNDLPDASKLNHDAYPLSSMRVNYRANALGIIDIKSEILGHLLENMGITDPTRFVFTLRNRWTTSDPDTTNYYVIRRNYDPDTWLASSYINGQLWTYPLVSDVLDGSQSYVFTEPVDPLAYIGLLNTPVAGYINFLLPGGFFTRLTRDDVAGLYYLYRKDNYNIETVTLSVTTTLGGGPWGNPGSGTNTTGTNVIGTNSFVQTAFRGGIGKITYRRADYDGLLGWFTAFTNSYKDTYITNGGSYEQYLDRPVQVPDILFDAADLHGGDGADDWVIGVRGTQDWISSITGTNDPSAGTGFGLKAGPGIIPAGFGVPSYSYTFNTVSEFFWNTFPVDNMDELTAVKFLLWGSCDGTTNAPFVYPIGRDVRHVEQQILDRDRGMIWGQP